MIELFAVCWINSLTAGVIAVVWWELELREKWTRFKSDRRREAGL